jgi:hypothetical protein
MKTSKCNAGDCTHQQGRNCPTRAVRWPVLCTRCGSTSHFAEDCTRMPAGMGLAQEERDHLAHARADRNAVLLGVLCFVLALVLIGMLERVPS